MLKNKYRIINKYQRGYILKCTYIINTTKKVIFFHINKHGTQIYMILSNIFVKRCNTGSKIITLKGIMSKTFNTQKIVVHFERLEMVAPTINTR